MLAWTRLLVVPLVLILVLGLISIATTGFAAVEGSGLCSMLPLSVGCHEAPRSWHTLWIWSTIAIVDLALLSFCLYLRRADRVRSRLS